MAKPRNHRKRYTREEEDYIRNNHGEKSVSSIARAIGRTPASVRYKQWSLGLPLLKNAGEYISRTEVQNILGVSSSTLWLWEQKGTIQFIRDKSKFGNMAAISLNSLLKFLKNNQDAWDSRRVELYAMGEEPPWLSDKRARDAKRIYNTNKYAKSFSSFEDLQIKSMLRTKTPRVEIARLLGRSEDSIRSRIRILRENGDDFLNEIAIKKKAWQKREETKLIKLYQQGVHPNDIAKKLSRTPGSVTNKIKLLKKAGRL